MNRWYRVFGTREAQPGPAAVAEAVQAILGPDSNVRFRGDDQGWFQVDLTLAAEDDPLQVICYLATEEGVRDQMNTWAAWLETTLPNPHAGRLMQHMIATRQVYTWEQTEEDDMPAKLCLPLCRFLARATDGVYQVDGQGFFDADGTLLVRESE